MSNIPHGNSDRYYNPENKIVYDGDTARAADLNALNDAVDVSLEAIAIDMDTLENLTNDNNILAERWASHVYSTDPIDGATGGASPVLEKPTSFSAFMNAQEAQGWASADEGAGIPLADGSTSSEESAKTHAANAEIDAGLADDARILAEAAAETSIGNNNIIAGEGIAVEKVENPPSSGDYDYTVSNTKSEAGAENDLINGYFDVWQRSTVSSAPNAWDFLADRWKSHIIGGTSFLQRSGDWGAYYLLANIITANYFFDCYQPILQENLERYKGKTITISVSIATSNLEQCELKFDGGGASGDVQVGTFTAALVDTWEKFTFQYNVPDESLTGDGRLYFGTTGIPADGTIRVGSFELYISDEELPVRRKTETEELTLCYPYFEKIEDYSGLSYRYGVATTWHVLAQTIAFKGKKIQAPSHTYTGGDYTNCVYASIITGEDGASLRVTITATGFYRAWGHVHYFDSEID